MTGLLASSAIGTRLPHCLPDARQSGPDRDLSGTADDTLFNVAARTLVAN